MRENVGVGVDINLVVEQRTSDGWQLVYPPYGPVWYDVRDSTVFTLLAGQPIAGTRISPSATIAPPRDWPPDLSNAARRGLCKPWSHFDDPDLDPDVSSEPDDDGFGRSWLDVADLLAFDWDQRVDWTFVAALDGPPVEITEDVRTAVAAHMDRYGWVPPGWGICKSAADGFEITTTKSWRQLASGFLPVVEAMQDLAGDDPASVRCVFQFSY